MVYDTVLLVTHRSESRMKFSTMMRSREGIQVSQYIYWMYAVLYKYIIKLTAAKDLKSTPSYQKRKEKIS